MRAAIVADANLLGGGNADGGILRGSVFTLVLDVVSVFTRGSGFMPRPFARLGSLFALAALAGTGRSSLPNLAPLPLPFGLLLVRMGIFRMMVFLC